jgi:hypothetical protein
MEESAQRARELIESLERQRASILHALALPCPADLQDMEPDGGDGG